MDAVPGGGTAINYTLRPPRGVAGLISPWNLPLYLLTWKIAPAIATGNTCVAKPSEVTPATATLLCEKLAESGIPAGVVNVIHGLGDEAGAPIVEHSGVSAVSFTGSTKVGQWIGERCGRALKPVSLELGGKNPTIIFDDADMTEAIPTAVRAAFSNQGQICLCGSRLLVQSGVYDEFVRTFVERTNAITIGDPLEESTQHGASVSVEHTEKIAKFVDRAAPLHIDHRPRGLEAGGGGPLLGRGLQPPLLGTISPIGESRIPLGWDSRRIGAGTLGKGLEQR